MIEFSVLGAGLRDALMTLGGTEFLLLPLQTGQLSGLMDQPSWYRSVAAFVSVFAIGAIMLFRSRSFISDSVTATIERPAVAVFYGFGAHAMLGFFGYYLGDQLVQKALPTGEGGMYGILVTVVIVATLGAWGFTVIGTAISESLLGADVWGGLAIGSAFAAVVAFIEPLAAVAIWVILVSISTGGRIRWWVHAYEAEEEVTQ